MKILDFFELRVEKFFEDSRHRASFWHYTCSFRGQSWPKWRCHTRQKFSSQCQHKFLWRKSISSFDTSASRLYLCFFWRIKRLDGNQVHPVIWLSRDQLSMISQILQAQKQVPNFLLGGDFGVTLSKLQNQTVHISFEQSVQWWSTRGLERKEI